MVRILHPPASLALLLSAIAIALASPLPQQRDGRPNADWFGRFDGFDRVPCTTHSRIEASTFVFGSGRDRRTDVFYTTQTTVEYTTLINTVTDSVVDAPGDATLTTASVATPAVTTTSQTLPTAAPPSLDITSTSVTSETTLSLATNASTTLLANSTLPLPTTVLNTTVLSSASASLSANISTPLTLPMTTSPVGAPLTSPLASATSTSICGPSAIAPAPTNAGTVANCTWWYVAQPGDYCSTVAQQFGLDVDVFMAWNPSVLPPTCPMMLAGDAYCVQICTSLGGTAASTVMSSTSSSLAASSASTTALVTPSSIVPSPSISTSTAPTSAASASPSSGAPVAYRSFNGDGTAAAGWPTEDDWISFDSMFTLNTPDMQTSCDNWGVPNNSPSEIATMREQILSVGGATDIDARFILAIIMQESTGCVRVITTAYSHANPGLMQSFNGTGSCNPNSAPLGLPGVTPAGEVLDPCPESEIRQMILDGTNGTEWGSGLVQDLAEQGRNDSSKWYRTARLYNGGSVVDTDLAQPCCTPSYASDVANRLLGWTTGPRTFTQV